MFYLLKSVSVTKLSTLFDFEWEGSDYMITNVAPVDDRTVGSLTFSSEADLQDSLCLYKGAITFTKDLIKAKNHKHLIACQQPRDVFCQVLSYLKKNIGFRDTHSHSISTKASISPLAVIEDGVIIEDDVEIDDFVCIKRGSHIKCGSHIRAFSSIGDDGFGFGKDSSGKPIRFEHLGGVKIGRGCEIGAFSTVNKGALSDTIIGDNVKVDAHVHIAHNCIIADNCILTAGSILSGGVKLKANAWLGPNCSILQKTSIGRDSLIGIGSVVLKNIKNNQVVAGNPSRLLKENESK